MGREKSGLGRDVEYREAFEYPQPFRRCAGVSGTCFVDDKLRDANLERVPSFLPPFPRDLLVAGNDQIPARPRSQIARNGCFEIQSLLHHSIASHRLRPRVWRLILSCANLFRRGPRWPRALSGCSWKCTTNPEKALSDGANALRLSLLGDFFRRLRGIDGLVKPGW